MCASTRPVFLSLGSNLGDRRERLQTALRLLEESVVRVNRISSIYLTDPVDLTEQPAFLNLVCWGETDSPARRLLQACLEVERRMGRVRTVRAGPRPIDVDILFLGTEIVSLPGLRIPHPRLYRRRFVLVPLEEIAPDFPDPISGRSVKQLLKSCPDSSGVRRFSCPPLSTRGGADSRF